MFFQELLPISPSIQSPLWHRFSRLVFEASVNFPKAIIEWLKGNPVDTSMLVPQYGRMFAKNDCLVEVR